MPNSIQCSNCSKLIDLCGQITFGMHEGKMTLICPYCNSKVLAVSGPGTKAGTLKKWKIFKHEEGDIQAIKQGWSWPGFVFTYIWAFVKGLYFLGAAILIAAVPILYFMRDTEQVTSSLLGEGIYVFIAIILGIKGNKWREKKLLKKDYVYKTLVEAENDARALDVFKLQDN